MLKHLVPSLGLCVLGLFAACGSPGGGGGGTVNCAALPTAPACRDTTSSGDATATTPDGTGTTATDTSTDTTTCTPDCSGKTCGPNGCGGFCGSCTTAGTTCVAGACVEGECGAGGVTATGQLAVGPGITFDKATIAVEHKMDVDAFEDGCITSVVITLGRGFGCELRVEANTATAPGGGLRITEMSFAADSQCPGFPDESEGQYSDFSGMRVLAVVPDIDKVPDANAPKSCVTTNFRVKLEGVLSDGDKTLNVGATNILVSGEVSSTGSTTASCPCAASCAGKDCGNDGCGFTCGVCGDNEECDGGGQCQCIPECSGKECGDNGCGGACGTCGEFEACQDGTCIACTPQCSGKECGDNGCGGECGECLGGETCNASGQCNCGGVTCAGQCCDAGEKCAAGECCAPQCAGKECGSDGCGGTCGSCTGAGETCQANGQCSCTPSCQGKECGSNGCGGSCGSCGAGESCLPEGVCATQTEECDFNDFQGATEAAIDRTDLIQYLQFSSTSASFDMLEVQMWKVNGTYPFQTQAAYDIPGGNYATCALCILIYDGCTEAAGCDNATVYMAQSGTFAVTTFADAVGESFAGGIANVVFKEVTIDPTTFESTLVPNGRTWCVFQVGLGAVNVTLPP